MSIFNFQLSGYAFAGRPKFCDLDKECGFRLLIDFCVCRAGRVVSEGVALSGFLSRAAKFVYEEFNV